MRPPWYPTVPFQEEPNQARDVSIFGELDRWGDSSAGGPPLGPPGTGQARSSCAGGAPSSSAAQLKMASASGHHG